MAKKSEKEVLEVGVDVEKALQDMTKMERATKRNFNEVAKAVDKLNGVNKRASKDAEAGNDRWQAGLEDLTKAYKEEGKAIENVLENIDILTRKAATASDEEKKNIQEQIKGLKNLGAAKIKALHGKENKEGRAMADNMFKDARGELKSALKETISSVFSKDLKGVVENSAKVLVKGLKLSAASGLKLGNAGSGLMSRGKERGGMGGAAMQAGGGAMKGIGAMMGGIKPLIDTLTKMGPVIGMIGGAIMGLVKIFLDMDAKVKDFNKDLLQSASNTEFMARSGNNASMSYLKISDTLDGVRNAAYDLSNIKWGISPDEYKAMVNTLTQEGVSLARIGDEAERSGKTVQDFTADLAHVSIAYSRAFGVPLQEINQLQAEMMTEMGADLTQTKVAFQQMNRAAQDSGISANKFFGMIRGVSQDLSLWGTRMEDAVKLLGRLGQVMNPRNAAKFMQTAAQGLKNMGRTERLRLSLLTGQGKMGKLIDRDIKRKADGLAKSFGMTGDEIMSKISSKEGRGELEEKIKGMDPSQQGALREALIDAQLQVARKGKGTFGAATAARTLGPAAALEAMQGALVKFGGGKKLSDIVGTIGGEMMAENLGISEEQLDQMAKFEASIDNQREALKKQLASGNAEQMTAARDALKQAGITAKNDEELAKTVDAAGYDQIMDTLSESDKKLLAEEAKVEDMAKKQAGLQTSMLKQLEMILDWLMNQIYNILMGIWDMIGEIPGIGKGKAQKDLEKTVYASKNADMLKRLEGAGGDAHKFKASTIMEGGLGKSLAQALDKFKNATGDDKTTAGYELSKFTDSINREFKDAGKIHELFNSMGMKGAEAFKVIQAMEKSGKSFGAAMGDAGLTSEQQSEALKKALWFMEPAEIAKLSAKTGGGAGAAPSSAATSQATSAAKSGATGGPGGGQAAVGTAGPAAASAAAASTAKTADESLTLSAEQAKTMQSIDNQMDKFKMDTSFLSGPYSKAVEGSVLKAVRTALFEYYMYKDLDQGSVVEAMKNGGLTAGTFGSQLTDMSLRTGLGGEDVLGHLKAPANAQGGLVTGVNGGMAMVTAAAGEGLASVGPGERITPRSGGGGLPPISIAVNGVGGDDLRRIIEAKVIDGIHEYKRKERFH